MYFGGEGRQCDRRRLSDQGSTIVGSHDTHSSRDRRHTSGYGSCPHEMTFTVVAYKTTDGTWRLRFRVWHNSYVRGEASKNIERAGVPAAKASDRGSQRCDFWCRRVVPSNRIIPEHQPAVLNRRYLAWHQPRKGKESAFSLPARWNTAAKPSSPCHFDAI